MDRGAWLAVVLEVAKSQTRLKRVRTHACEVPSTETGSFSYDVSTEQTVCSHEAAWFIIMGKNMKQCTNMILS